MGVIDREYLGAKRGDKPTESDLLKLEVRDLLESVGELRLALDALARKVAKLEANSIDIDRPWTGTIQGLEGEITVSLPPEWEA